MVFPSYYVKPFLISKAQRIAYMTRLYPSIIFVLVQLNGMFVIKLNCLCHLQNEPTKKGGTR